MFIELLLWSASVVAEAHHEPIDPKHLLSHMEYADVVQLAQTKGPIGHLATLEWHLRKGDILAWSYLGHTDGSYEVSFDPKNPVKFIQTNMSIRLH